MSNELNLYGYQSDAVQKFKESGRRGSLIFATGTGKTEIAIGIIKDFLGDFPNGKVVFIVPRIVLIDQTAARLANYGQASTTYYGENKDFSGQVIVSTYQSLCKLEQLEAQVKRWLDVHSNVLFIFDEVHLANDNATNYIKIMKSVKEFTPANVSMLALTATIDETDMERNGTILTSCPVLERIQMGAAIESGFLSEVKLVDASVSLTRENQMEYERISRSLQRIFEVLKTSDPKQITTIAKFSPDPEKKSAAWGYLKCVQVKTRILNLDENKICKVSEILSQISGKTLLFSERVAALEGINNAINNPAIFRYIEAKTPKKVRKQIIEDFAAGKFLCLGTVHTLDIGFDQKDVANCIFLASNQNANQLIQRLGRGVRKAPGKEHAMIYVLYARGTSEANLMGMIRGATTEGRTVVNG